MMMIEKVDKAKYHFKKEIANNVRRFLIQLIFLGILIFTSTTIFFFVEECYFHVPQPPTSYNQMCNQLCQNTKIINETQSNNTEIVNLFGNVTKFCVQAKCNLEEHVSQRNCKLGPKNVFKWWGFVVTTIFTIGYGRTVAKSTLGRALTIVMAIIGIPMASANVLFCGKAINNTIKYLIVCFENACLKRQKIVWLKRKVAAVQIYLTISTILLHSVFYKMTTLQESSFFEIIYYVCVTMLTIGFGDVYPDTTYLYQLSMVQLVIFTSLDVAFFYWTFSLLGSIIDFIRSLETDLGTKENKKDIDGNDSYVEQIDNSIIS
ncbi:potassium channel subfamily K member 9-like [Clytia hemisphaerica]|uniref:Potassium channel domain-containing protein n=1 Tax=Clytia hemisphaerica TaxID=252671 RepID=A0A7M5USL3_9CNID